jgi:hypothetical protein
LAGIFIKEVLLGDFSDMAEHMARAQELQHPLHHSHRVREDLQAAIEFIVRKRESDELCRARDSRLASLKRKADLLRRVDVRLRSMQSGAAHRRLVKTRDGRTPSIALWAALVRAMDWPDTTVIDGLLVGFPTVGAYPATGIFREKERAAEH